MEIHQLRYFLAVARQRNFSRAAEECNVAQPSLSQQIIKLEDELGTRLFDRSNREVRLTETGQVFQEHAVRILDELHAASEAVNLTQNIVRGKITLGVLPTIAPYYLPRRLCEFATRYPDVEVTVHEDTTARLAAAIQTRDIDLALTSLPVTGNQIGETELFSEELWLALPRNHSLASRENVSIKELQNEPFILMQEGHCLAGQSLQFCSMRGFSPQVRFRSAQMETIHSFVAEGHGVSLIPAMARQPDNRQVVYRHIRGSKPTRPIGLIYLEGRSQGTAWASLVEFFKTTTPSG